MKENVDYQLVPAEVDNDQAWEVRILTGEFVETVIRFGNVVADGTTEQIHFNFMVTHSLDESFTVENEELQRVAGEILGDLIENAVEEGSLVLDERKEDDEHGE